MIYTGSRNELFIDTIRLNTGCPGMESLQSAQKNPLRTNWKLSYAFASSSSGSTTQSVNTVSESGLRFKLPSSL